MGNYLVSFSVAGGFPTMPLWTIRAASSKVDQGIVFGYPQSSYFLHFTQKGGGNVFVTSKIALSTGVLGWQVYYTATGNVLSESGCIY